MEVRKCLEEYSRASGQVINYGKSEICFGKKVKMDMRAEVANLLRVQVTVGHERYLGLPMTMGRSKAELFQYIRERVWNKVWGWKISFFLVCR